MHQSLQYAGFIGQEYALGSSNIPEAIVGAVQSQIRTTMLESW